MWNDESTHYVMRSHMRGETYATLTWPKNATVRELEHIRTLTNLQLDQFIESARRKTERREAADAEYDSWFAVSPAQAGKGGDTHG